MRRRLTRRQFVRGVAAALGALLLDRCVPGERSPTPAAHTATPLPTGSVPPPPSPSGEPTSPPRPTGTTPAPATSTPQATGAATQLPSPTVEAIPTAAPASPTPAVVPIPPRSNRVTHVRAAEATGWDFASGWYGDHVRQDVVEEMVAQGLMYLTGTGSVAAAWAALLPGYQPGQKIAIKVSFNNCMDCGDSDNRIDGLIEPVNALVGGMKQIGVLEEDVWVYDARRPLPTRFFGRCAYPGVVFLDRIGCASQVGFAFSSSDPTTYVRFSVPGLRDRRITDVLVNATYLINMPVLKRHGIHPVSLGLKNHFGSIDPKPDDLHPYIDPQNPSYRADFSPLVEICANPHIAGKTILTMGDGLFGASGATQPPTPWRTFGGDAPSSLFFSRDPVAVDGVMCDFVNAEYGVGDRAYDYLRLAAEWGMGSFERGDPWGGGYGQIDYLRLDL